MRTISMALALAASLLATPLAAEVLAVPSAATATTATVRAPERGSTMAEVLRRFGEPTVKHPSVGGDRREHPRITRWDYAEFSVVFERNKVIDVVIHDAPMPVQNPDALEAASP